MIHVRDGRELAAEIRDELCPVSRENIAKAVDSLCDSLEASGARLELALERISSLEQKLLEVVSGAQALSQRISRLEWDRDLSERKRRHGG